MSKIIGMDGKKGPTRSKPGLNAQINLKPQDMDDIVCEQCGGKYFRQVNAFKKMSALVSPTGKEQIVPVPTFRCDDCGYINKEFRIIEKK
jgi:DNA-directed RNA polymerase subunit RPC12/RpoP